MPHKAITFLYDVKKACGEIEDFLKDKTLADYKSDRFLQSAVERQFIIIGEALNQSLKIDPALSEKITDIRRIVGFRNILVHGYSTVENDTVWGFIEGYLSVLVEEVDAILKELEEDEK